MLNYLIAILMFNVEVSQSYQTNPPIWVTSDFFQAGNRNIIDELTTSDETPVYTFNFDSNFTDIPLLGYGFKDYEGNHLHICIKVEII